VATAASEAELSWAMQLFLCPLQQSSLAELLALDSQVASQTHDELSWDELLVWVSLQLSALLLVPVLLSQSQSLPTHCH
jgi:hypothetical protein